MVLGDMEKQVFKTKIANKTDQDLVWMMEQIEVETRKREFDLLKDREFRVCDKCNQTWPESEHYCRCGNKNIMRVEKVLKVR